MSSITTQIHSLAAEVKDRFRQMMDKIHEEAGTSSTGRVRLKTQLDKEEKDRQALERQVRSLRKETKTQLSKAAEERRRLREEEAEIARFAAEIARREEAAAQMGAAKLAKITSTAGNKIHTEQGRLLTDKEFSRANVRVPATLDNQRPESGNKKQAQNADDRDDGKARIAQERERIKKDVSTIVFEKTKPMAKRNLKSPDLSASPKNVH